jgi:hypothetical protein
VLHSWYREVQGEGDERWKTVKRGAKSRDGKRGASDRERFRNQSVCDLFSYLFIRVKTSLTSKRLK